MSRANPAPNSDVPASTSGKAIASLVCGLLSFFCALFTGIPAVILGILGLKDVNRSQGRVGGKGLAIAGIVLGSVGIMWTCVSFGLLLPAIAAAREAARITVASNNLKQIGMALNNFEQNRRRYPGTAESIKPGGPPVSWRVMITPYIERADLWRAYTENLEPWDSEKNKGLLSKMPTLFESAGDSDPKPGTTNFVAIVGDKTAFPSNNKVVGLDDISQNDGAANTLLLVEVSGMNIPWTEPRDMPVEDFIKGINQPGGPKSIYSRGILGLFADGSVRIIDVKTTPEELKAMTTYNGHEQSH